MVHRIHRAVTLIENSRYGRDEARAVARLRPLAIPAIPAAGWRRRCRGARCALLADAFTT